MKRSVIDILDLSLEEIEGLLDTAQDIIANEYIYLPMYNVGGHPPYYDGNRVTGWSEDYPINFALNLINVHPVD